MGDERTVVDVDQIGLKYKRGVRPDVLCPNQLLIGLSIISPIISRSPTLLFTLPCIANRAHLIDIFRLLSDLLAQARGHSLNLPTSSTRRRYSLS